ncbi:MAG: HemK2/MTQ2 family protein methyltransferase [Candidatus Heimdallarchaeaceae archaeon]
MVQYNFPKYKITMDIPEEVYFPSEDTFLLLDSIRLKEKDRVVLEIGSGSGIISIVLGKKKPKTCFVATDLSIIATKTIKKNSEINSVNNLVEVICGDKFKALRKFSPEVIIWNPPYLPLEEELHNISKHEKFMLYGGIKGFEEAYDIINYILKEKIKTRFFTIFSSLAWNKSELENFKEKKVSAQIINEKKYFFERLYVVEFNFNETNGG